MREREGGEPSPWCRALDARGTTGRDLAVVESLLSGEMVAYFPPESSAHSKDGPFTLGLSLMIYGTEFFSCLDRYLIGWESLSGWTPTVGNHLSRLETISSISLIPAQRVVIVSPSGLSRLSEGPKQK
jgi:hypothetical protein